MKENEARSEARVNPKNLRHVRDVGDQDVAIIEDLDTGERRYVPNKARAMYGLRVAYELGKLIPEFAVDEETQAG